MCKAQNWAKVGCGESLAKGATEAAERQSVVGERALQAEATVHSLGLVGNRKTSQAGQCGWSINRSVGGGGAGGCPLVTHTKLYSAQDTITPCLGNCVLYRGCGAERAGDRQERK